MIRGWFVRVISFDCIGGWWGYSLSELYDFKTIEILDSVLEHSEKEQRHLYLFMQMVTESTAWF
jgi:hypothetical protein